MLKIKYRTLKAGRRTVDSLLSHNGYRIELSTGITLPDGIGFEHPRTFTGGHPNDRAELESQISSWESKIRSKYDQLVVNHGYGFPNDVFRNAMRIGVSEARGVQVVDGRTTLSAFVEQVNERIASGLITRKSNGRPYTKRSLDMLRFIVDRIDEFVIKYGDFDFGRYNLDTEDVLGKLQVVNAYDKLCEQFKNFLIKDKNYGNRCVEDTVCKTKFIIKERCESHGINITDRYLSKLKYKGSVEQVVVPLSQEQFEWILGNEDRLREDNRMSKWAGSFIDYLIAGLLTGARISDLDKLTMDNLIKNDDGYILSYTPQKTRNSSGATVEVPVPERLVNIFLKNANKYDGKLLKAKGTTPVKHAAACCREIIKRYDIFQAPTHIRDKHGNLIVKPFWKAFKFHGTRASLITYLLANGEQETIIKSISGHTLDSQSFTRYVRITNDMKLKTLQKVAMLGVVR